MLDGPNLYAYARNNPASYQDLTGLKATQVDPDLDRSEIEDAWNYTVQALTRAGTNAFAGAITGFAIGGLAGAIVGGAIGGVTGLIHGGVMAYGRTYDWRTHEGWFEFIADNSWSLPNSLVASVVATVNLFGNDIDWAQTRGTGSIVFKKKLIAGYATTLPGNVTMGTLGPRHERLHVLQARLLGPLYIPSILSHWAILTAFPYWLAFQDDPIESPRDYFVKGVYRHAWHEAWAFGAVNHKAPGAKSKGTLPTAPAPPRGAPAPGQRR
jgi:hypothetical protein